MDHKHSYRVVRANHYWLKWRCQHCSARLHIDRRTYREIMVGLAGIDDRGDYLTYIDLEPEPDHAAAS